MVQNRAISRYALFVVLKLFTSRFRDTTNRAFLNPIQLPRAFVHTPQKVRPCTSLSSLRESGNLRRAPDLAQFHRISFCAPEPRDNALCTVCCMETKNTSLSRRQQTECFFPKLRSLALFCHFKCHICFRAIIKWYFVQNGKSYRNYYDCSLLLFSQSVIITFVTLVIFSNRNHYVWPLWSFS